MRIRPWQGGPLLLCIGLLLLAAAVMVVVVVGLSPCVEFPGLSGVLVVVSVVVLRAVLAVWLAGWVESHGKRLSVVVVLDKAPGGTAGVLCG